MTCFVSEAFFLLLYIVIIITIVHVINGTCAILEMLFFFVKVNEILNVQTH